MIPPCFVKQQYLWILLYNRKLVVITCNVWANTRLGCSPLGEKSLWNWTIVSNIWSANAPDQYYWTSICLTTTGHRPLSPAQLNLILPPSPIENDLLRHFNYHLFFLMNSGMGSPNRFFTLQWRHNKCNGNHQPHECFLKRLFRRRSKKTPKFHVTGLCVGNSPVTNEFLTQRPCDAENLVTSSCVQEMSGTDANEQTMKFLWFTAVCLTKR